MSAGRNGTEAASSCGVVLYLMLAHYRCLLCRWSTLFAVAASVAVMTAWQTALGAGVSSLAARLQILDLVRLLYLIQVHHHCLLS